MKKVLVTGVAGFIGSNLADRLLAEGYDVIGIDNLSTGKKENIPDGVQFIEGDIREGHEKTMEGVDTVFHLAALPRIQPSITNPITSNQVNVDGTLRVLFSAYKAGVKRVVYSASSSVYGDNKLPLKESMTPKPKTPYSLQKLIGEQYCELFSSELYNLDTVCLRYFNVYGERQADEGAYATVIGIFLKQRANGYPLTIVGTGKRTRDFTYVGDVVDANIKAMNHKGKLKGAVMNIGTGERHSVKQIADWISKNQTYIPDRPGEIKDTLADNKKATTILKWKPTKKLEEWIKSQ